MIRKLKISQLDAQTLYKYMGGGYRFGFETDSLVLREGFYYKTKRRVLRFGDYHA